MISLFDQVVDITQDLLGPAAERFLARQVTAHLGKAPEDLEISDLSAITEWTKVSLALLTDDKSAVDACIQRIMRLSV